MYNLPITILKKPLLKYLFTATLTLCCLFYAEVSFGQEYYDATNSPRQYYYNNLESATAGSSNPETYFPNSVSTQTNTAIKLVANSSLNNTKSFSTTGSSTLVGSIAWNFMSNSLSPANTSLTGAAWEWEFDYKNVANAAPNEDGTAATIAPGKNAWRYWLIAGTSKLGIYVTQTSDGKLEGRERFNSASNGYRIIWSVDMPINTDTYQIRIEKSVIGYYNVFVYDRTANTTKSSLNINVTYSDGVDLSIYNLSYLEASSTTADRFQFDNFNFYQVRLDYIPVSDNGISSPIYPGMGTATIYGVNVCVRGDIAMGRFALKYTSGTEKLFGDNPTAKLYTTSTLPFSTTGLTAYKSITMNNGGSSQYVDLPPLTYYSAGGTDGSTLHVDYYFVTIGVLSTFVSGYPTSVSYSVSNLNNDTYSDFFRGVSPYSASSSSSASAPTLNGDLWDWNGASGATWKTTAAWKKNKTTTTTAIGPGASTDIVRIGVSQYTSAIQPSLTVATSIAALEVGSFGTNSTTATPVTIDMAGFNLTITNGLKIDAASTLKLINSSSSTESSLAISGTSTIASTGSITWPTTNKANLDNSGTLTLKSDASGTGSIGSLVNTLGTKTGTVKGSGTFSVERYFTGGSTNSRGYRLLSSPVSSSSSKLYIPNLSYINSGSFTTGKGGTGKGFSAASIAGPTLYFYRENLAPNNSNFTSGNFRGVSDISQNGTFTLENETGTFNLPAGNGFMFYFRGGTSTASPYVTASISQTATLTSTGYLNQGDITVSDWFTPSSTYLSYTNSGAIANSGIRGYNLVGNPYPSSIDWDLVYTSNNPTDDVNGIDKTIYVYNPAKKAYATYKAGKAGIGTNFNQSTNNNILPSGQGFFVIAHGTNNTLTFHEANKSTAQVTSSGLSLATAANNNAASLKYMRVELFKDSLNSEESLVFFDAKSKPDYSLEEDAKYLKGSGVVNFSTQSSDNIALAINQTAFPQKNQIIPLNVNVTTSGTYQLKLTEIKNIPAVYNVWLIDDYKKDSLDIKNNPVYTFNANTADTNSYKGKRFSLAIRQNPALAVHLLNFDATKSTSDVKIKWTVENEANYTTYVVQRSTDGGKSYKIVDSLTSAGLGNYTDLDQSPILGDNYYRLMQIDIAGGVSYSNVIKVMYANTAANNIIANSNISVYPNPAQSVLNLAVTNADVTKNTIAQAGSYKITITNAMGSLVKTETAASASWQGQIANLLPGTYFIQVINTKDNTLTGKSTFVKL
jgi:hypothetical protein